MWEGRPLPGCRGSPCPRTLYRPCGRRAPEPSPGSRRKPGPAPPARRSFLGLNLKGALGCSVSREPLPGGRAMGSSIAGGATGYPAGCWERGESPAILRRCSITELGCGAPTGPCGSSLGESHRSRFRPTA